MADQKITELVVLKLPVAVDLLPIVDDPSGGAATKKIAISDLLTTTVKHHGALGDGVANDGAEIRAAAASFPSKGGLLEIPHGQYEMDAVSASCLLITKPMIIRGHGGIYTALNPSLAGSTDTTLNIAPTSALDFGSFLLEGFSLHDPTTGTRAGRYGVFADTQAAGENLSKFTMRDMRIGEGAHADAWGFYHLNNAVANVNGGMFGALIENCAIKGGVRFEESGDSNSVVNSILTGKNIGVWASLISGASLLEVQACNITNDDGAFHIDLGHRTRFIGNNCENTVAGSLANNNAAVVDFNGANGVMHGGVVTENLISAFGTSDATTLLRLVNCRGLLVQDNVFQSGGGAGTTAISIAASCQDIRIGGNAYNVAVTTKVSDSGVGTMGVVKTPSLSNSWVEFSATQTSAQFMKSIDGMVHIWGIIKDGTTTNGTLLFTLPVGFRPTEIMRFPIFVDNAGTAQIAQLVVESSGAVTIQFVLASDQLDLTGSFPADNVADSVSLE